MNAKREIDGLGQAVVLLMYALDRVFAHRVQNWRIARRGFEIILLKNIVRPAVDQTVKIHPVGLPPEDIVFCRFQKNDNIWLPYKGSIGSEHSAEEIRNFAFNATLATSNSCDYQNLIHPRNFEKEFEEILSRELKFRCETS